MATDEIRFGDNDNLSATVVNLVAADLLVILTDVDGLYTEFPTAGRRKPPLYDVIDRGDSGDRARRPGLGERFGRGGMITKLEAAASAASAAAPPPCCATAAHARRARLRAPPARIRWARCSSGERSPAASTGWPSRPHPGRAGPRRRRRKGADEARQEPAAGGHRRRAREVRHRRPGGLRGSPGRRDRPRARRLLVRRHPPHRGVPTREIDAVLGYSNGDEVIHRDDLVLLRF